MAFFGKIIYSTLTSASRLEKLQENIRDQEWSYIAGFITQDSSFLDVGCGTGYAMMRAKKDKNCNVTGIDPNPGAHGVGRFEKNRVEGVFDIHVGHSEFLPFPDSIFDVVYSSHVLEHVNDEKKTLQEIKRVVKDSGTIIIGVPTSRMAILNLFSQILFTTHIKIYENVRFIHKAGRWKRLINIFRIRSHSFPRSESIWYDISHYRTKNWKKIIECEMTIESIHFPLWYPYPDFPQLFVPKRRKNFGSSVFFICKRK